MQYLATLLIVQQLVEQFLETGLPYLILRFWRKGDNIMNIAEKKKDDDVNVEAAKGLAEEQSKMDVYPVRIERREGKGYSFTLN